MTKYITGLALSISMLAFTACGQSTHNAVKVETDKIESIKVIDVAALHEQIITVDTHVDIPLTYMTDAMDPGTDTDAQVDLGKMEAGGLDAVFFIVYTPQTDIKDAKYEDARKIAETRYDAIVKLTQTHGDRIEFARSADDVRRINKIGKKAALIGMENAFPLGTSVDDVPMWAARGVRYMGITHMGHNQFGDSSNPKIQWGETDDLYGGLSPLGKELIIAMNKAGIMVDVSHAGKTTMMQAAALSSVPVIASHSGAKAISDSPRNLDDEQLRAIAKNDGVAQMVAFAYYVKVLSPVQERFKMDVRVLMGLETDKKLYGMDEDTQKKYFAALKPMAKMEARATVSDFADHIDHAVKIAGIDHVGISSDFDGGGGVTGWENASETANVTAELVKRGYSEEDITKIWGGNLLRVLEAVQEGADTKHGQ